MQTGRQTYYFHFHFLFDIKPLIQRVLYPTLAVLISDNIITTVSEIQTLLCEGMQSSDLWSVLWLPSLVPSPMLERWVWLLVYSKLGQHYVSGPRSGPAM